jgi:hypothetical protein
MRTAPVSILGGMIVSCIVCSSADHHLVDPFLFFFFLEVGLPFLRPSNPRIDFFHFGWAGVICLCL